jgi:hypothetical protein
MPHAAGGVIYGTQENTWRHLKSPRAPRVTQNAAQNVVTLQKGMPHAPQNKARLTYSYQKESARTPLRN